MSQEAQALTSGSEELTPPFVAGAGLFLGVSAFALSVTGILWRINVLSVGACLVSSLLVLALWVRRLGARCEIRIWALLLLLPLLVVPTIAALTPPHEWDEVAYGAALPRDYAAAGRFFYNADYGPFSAFPSNYEALTTAAIVLTGDVAPTHVVTVLLALGLAAIAVHLSRRLGAPWPLALCAAVLVLSAEAMVTTVARSKNDVANAFFQSLALLAIVAYAVRRELSWLALGGFFLGTALGVKYSSLEFALCVAPLTAALVLTRPGCVSGRLRDLGVCGAVALASALPWYARNYFVLDNPIFPFLNELLGARNGFTPEQSAIAREMFNGLTGYSWHTGTASSFLQKTIRGFGWVPVLLSIPGLLAAVLRRRDAASAFLGMVWASFGLLTLFAGYWLPRYFLTLLVLSSVFATVILAEICRPAGRALGRRATVVALAIVVLAVGGSSLRWQWTTGWRFVQDAVRLKRQDFVRTHVRFWEVADWANRNLGPNDKIAVGLNVQPFYYLNRPYFHVHPMTQKGNLQSLETPEEFLRAFHTLGITWLAFSPYVDAESYPEASAPRMHAFLKRLYNARKSLTRSGQLTPVTALQGVRIYRIEPSSLGVASP
jgi:hypothetical protein